MEQNLTSGNPLTLIIRFSLPLLIGNIFQQFYNMADTVIVGKTLGMEALAAVGIAGTFAFLMFGFAYGFTSGLTIITGQRFGAGEIDNTRRSIAASFILTGAVSVLLTTVCLLFCRPILHLLNTPADVFDQTFRFLSILLLGLPAMVGYNLCASILRALGDSKTPLYFLTAACILNVLLDLVFIICFRWGIAGAAFATIFTQLLSGISCFLYAKRKFTLFQLRRQDWKADWPFIRKHLYIALPLAFQSSLIGLSIVFLQAELNLLGGQAVAAYTAGNKINQLTILPAFSFATALASFTAQNYGAKQYRRICHGVTVCGITTTIFGYITSLLAIVFSSQLTRFFVSGGEAELLTPQVHAMLIISGVPCILLTMLLTYRFALIGMGLTFIPLLGGLAELFMRGFFVHPLAKLWGYEGICLSSPLAWLGSLLMMGIVYHRKIHRLTGRFY